MDDRVRSRRLVFMQVMKLAILGVLAFVVIRFAPVWYRTSEFNSYVQQQTSGIHSKGVLTQVILQKAEKSKLPVTARDINFTTNDSKLEVNIEYQVPLDLYFYQKELSFHASGTGLFPEN
jgi:cytochrome c-type biogenesis protein CcmE